MALKLNERYPGRFNNPSAEYPQGSFKNRTTPAAKDGSYLEKDWANDKEGFFQSLLSSVGVVANGVVDKVGASQYFSALQALKQIQAGTAFTTAGSAGALTLAPTPAISAYSAPLRFRVKFSQASTGTDTLNISGLGVKSIKQYDSTGAKVAAVFALNQLADVEYDGTDMVVLDPLPSGAVQATESVAGVAKVATQALTNAGVDNTTMVTPKTFSAGIAERVIQATEAIKGIAKIATQAQVNAGSGDDVIVTPYKLRLGFAVSFNAKGYVVFPSWLGGLIIQWTSSAAIAPGGSGAAYWPIAFPNGCIWALAAPLGSTGNGNAGNVVAGGVSAVAVDLYNWGSAINSPARVIAFGV